MTNRRRNIGKQLARITTPRERIIHGVLWIAGLVMINIPSWQVTIGEFHSDDYSLLIPSLYGTLLNMLLFYGNIYLVTQKIQHSLWSYIRSMLVLFVAISGLEILLDVATWLALGYELRPVVIQDMILGNLLMNGIFFLLPSFPYGIFKTWQQQRPAITKLRIRDGVHDVLIELDDLRYVEADANYVKYHLGNRTILERKTLNQVAKALPSAFIQCHRSFIVNTYYVDELSYKHLHVDGQSVPLGRSYRKTVKEHFHAVSEGGLR